MKGELLKRDGYYIPWEYENYEDTNEKRISDCVMDVNAVLPKISWCYKYEKHKVEYCGADFSGYGGVRLFVRYFDTLEEVYEAMRKEAA